jgi:hypothetical protein
MIIGKVHPFPTDPQVSSIAPRLWASHEVRTARHLHKTIQHPVVGPITLNCDVPDQDQHVVIFTAAPGSPSDQALQLLAVLGTQRMDIHT